MAGWEDAPLVEDSWQDAPLAAPGDTLKFYESNIFDLESQRLAEGDDFPEIGPPDPSEDERNAVLASARKIAAGSGSKDDYLSVARYKQRPALRQLAFKEYAKRDLKKNWASELASNVIGLDKSNAEVFGRVVGPALYGGAVAPEHVKSVGTQIGMGVQGIASRAIGAWKWADDAARWSSAYEQASQELMAERNPDAQKIGQVGRSLATSLLPQAAIGKATRSAPASIAYGTAVTADRALEEARSAGKTNTEALLYAAKQGAYEALPELLMSKLGKIVPGLGGTESALAAQGLETVGKEARKAVVGIGAEAATEAFTGAAQELESAALTRREARPGAAAKEGALLGGLGASIVGAPRVAGSAVYGATPQRPPQQHHKGDRYQQPAMVPPTDSASVARGLAESQGEELPRIVRPGQPQPVSPPLVIDENGARPAPTSILEPSAAPGSLTPSKMTDQELGARLAQLEAELEAIDDIADPNYDRLSIEEQLVSAEIKKRAGRDVFTRKQGEPIGQQDETAPDAAGRPGRGPQVGPGSVAAEPDQPGGVPAAGQTAGSGGLGVGAESARYSAAIGEPDAPPVGRVATGIANAPERAQSGASGAITTAITAPKQPDIPERESLPAPENGPEPESLAEQDDQPPTGKPAKITFRDDKLDLGSLTDDQLRRWLRRNKQTGYGSDDREIATAAREELQKRGRQDYTEGPEGAVPLREKWFALRNLRMAKEEQVQGLKGEEDRTYREAVNTIGRTLGVPKLDRGDKQKTFGLSTAKQHEAKVAEAKQRAKQNPDHIKTIQARIDAEAAVVKAKEAEREAEDAYYAEAGKGFPEVPLGQVRTPIERGATPVTVQEFDPALGKYRVSTYAGDHWISPQPLLDNYLSTEERRDIEDVELRIRKVYHTRREQKAAAEEVERQKREATELVEQRQKGVGIFQETRYWRSLAERAKALRGQPGKVVTQLRKGKEFEGVEVEAEILDENWAITQQLVWDARNNRWSKPRLAGESGGASFSLTHIPTGAAGMEVGTANRAKEAYLLGEDAGVKWSHLKTKADVKGEPNKILRHLQDAVQNRSLGYFEDAVRQTVLAKAPAQAEFPQKADLVLGGAELGVGSVQTEAPVITSGRLKEMADAIPEFRYNPVFVVDSSRRLVFRDGVKLTLEPEQFNLGKHELKPGQSVGINLPELGIKLATEQEVVAEMLKAHGFANVKQDKDGEHVRASWKGRIVEVERYGKERWAAASTHEIIGIHTKHQKQEMPPLANLDAPVERARAVLERIRWQQPTGTAEEGPGKGKSGPLPEVPDRVLVELAKLPKGTVNAIVGDEQVTTLPKAVQHGDATEMYLRERGFHAHDEGKVFKRPNAGEYYVDPAEFQAWKAAEKKTRKPRVKKGEQTQSYAPRATDSASVEPKPTIQKGAPLRQARSSLPRSEESVNLAAADIMRTWERLFKVPLRVGGFRQRAAGIYKVLPEVVRQKEEHYANLAVAAHEIAHHLDKLSGVSAAVPAQAQLAALDYDPKQARPDEGWAEFLRHYITEGDTHAVAPAVHDWFEKTWLPAHPEHAGPIKEAAKQAREYADQSVFQRIRSLIADSAPHDTVFFERWKRQARSLGTKLYRHWVDRFAALETIEEEWRKRSGDTAAAGPYQAAMAYDMTASANAAKALEHGPHTLTDDRIVGPALFELRSLMKPGEYDEAVAYALARHTVREAALKPDYNTGLDLEDAQAWLDHIAKTPEKEERFEKVAVGLAAYNNALLDMAVNAGSMPPASRDRMQARYGDYYFPLYRVAEEGVEHPGGTVGTKLVNLPQLVRARSAKGSGRPIIDPFDATIAKTLQFYGRAAKSRVMHRLASQIMPEFGGVQGMGGFMTEIDPNKKVNTGTIEEILDTLVKAGMVEAGDAKAIVIAAKIKRGEPLSSKEAKFFSERHGLSLDDAESSAWLDAADEEPDALTEISLWRDDFTPSADKATVLYHDPAGAPHLIETDRDLYATATGLDDLQLPAFAWSLQKATQYFRAGAVGFSTGFGTTNLARDFLEYQGRAEEVSGAKTLVKPPEMLARYVGYKLRRLAGQPTEDALIEAYERHGGKLLNQLGYDMAHRQRVRKRRLGKSATESVFSWGDVKDLTGGTLESVQESIALSDAPPRLAEMEAAAGAMGYEARGGAWFKDGSSDPTTLPEDVVIRMMNAAAEATINFKRVGNYGRYVNAYSAFFNATIQAGYRRARLWRRTQRALTGKGTPGEQATARRYAVYLAASVASGIAYALMRGDDDDYREQESWFKDNNWSWGTNGWTYVRIPKPRDDGQLAANLAETLVDTMSSEDKKELLAEIYGTVARHVEAAVPEVGGGLPRGVVEAFVADYDYFRDKPLTPDYLKDEPAGLKFTPYTLESSKLIGGVTGPKLNISPIQVEHMLNSSSGGAYRRIVDSGESALRGELGVQHIPFVRGIAMNRHQAASLDDFYTERDRLALQVKWDTASGKGVAEDAKRLKRLNDYSDIMTQVRAADPKDERGRRQGKFDPYLVGLAREALNRQPLESNPSPLKDYANAPPEVREAVDQLTLRQARAVLLGRPVSLTEKEREAGVTLLKKREAWRQERSAAKEALRSSPVGKDAVLKAVDSWIGSDLKEWQAEVEKRRKFRELLDW